MPRVLRPANEYERLTALEQCGALGLSADPAFDDLALLAARLCQTPIALVSIVDEVGQHFKSAYGLDAASAHRDLVFCSYAIMQAEPLVIQDATQDPRFADNLLVTSDAHIRFYAGIPLRTSDGLGLGTLCVMDREPRTISPTQLADLVTLARQVTAQLELRRTRNQLTERCRLGQHAITAASIMLQPAAVELREALAVLRPLGSIAELAASDVAGALTRVELTQTVVDAMRPTHPACDPMDCVNNLLRGDLLPEPLRRRIQGEVLVPFPASARVDPVKLSFILSAMARNSLSTTPEGEVRLWISTGLAHGRTLLRFDVLDGNGAAPLADDPLLALAEGFARQLGGSLKATYVEGEGGTITLLLPSPDAESDGQSDLGESGAGRTGPLAA